MKNFINQVAVQVIGTVIGGLILAAITRAAMQMAGL